MQLQDAKAMIDLQEEAARRYKQYGIKPTQKDFRIKIDNAVTPSQEITNHEINHFNQYIHQDNPSWNKSELDKITKQFKGKLRDKNPIDPENTSYFMNWMEQNAYGINMLDRLKELNIKPLIKPIRGGTDGSRLSFMGLPCPNIFAGGHNFHGKYEYVPVESMQKAVEVIVKIAELNAIQNKK